MMKKEDIVEIINGYAYKEDNETPKIIEERDFENIAEEIVKLFAIPVVMQRSELLLFADYSESDKTSQTTDECVDNYLAQKSNSV